ncbi:MAG: carboxypeptidase-like regulatory domain-containing protein [Acidimicrobiia bacterium]
MTSLPAAGVPPPPVLPAERVRPSAWWFLAAAGIAVTGIVAAIVVAVMGVVRMYERIDDFARAAVPATFDVRIDEPGGYTIYVEHDIGPIGRTRAPDVEVTDPAGEPVRLRPYVGTVTYTTGDRDGTALYSFDADRPGPYTVEASGEPGITVAVGRGFGHDLTRSFAVAGALGLAGVVGGVVTAIVVGVRRSRARRSAWRPPPPGGAPPPGWGGPPAGWGGPPPGWGGPQPGAAPSPPGWAGPPGGAPTSPW